MKGVIMMANKSNSYAEKINDTKVELAHVSFSTEWPLCKRLLVAKGFSITT